MFLEIHLKQRISEAVKLIKASKFTIYELAYLLLHKDEGAKPIMPVDEKIIAFITKVRESLQAVNDEFTNLVGLPEEINKTLIGKIVSIGETATNQTVQIFNGSFTGTVADRDVIVDNSYGFVDPALLKSKLNDRDAAPPATKDEKTKEAYEELNKQLIAYLQNETSRRVIVQLHSEQFKIGEDVSNLLLSLVQLQATTVPLIDHWFNESLLGKDNSGNYVNVIDGVTFPTFLKAIA